MKSVLSVIIFASVFLTACQSAKDVNAHSEKEITEYSTSKRIINLVMEERLKEEGYKLGVVDIIEDSDCYYVIFLKETNTFLDPVNIETEKFSAFREKDLNIFIKYRPLRKMNRCDNAQPVELIDVMLIRE